ncbi:MAG: hypothetical protein QNL01_07910 [Akkermansiaceae bacterium]
MKYPVIIFLLGISLVVTQLTISQQYQEPTVHSSNEVTWPNASSWYWHAQLHPNDGPWLAQTLIRRHP